MLIALVLLLISVSLIGFVTRAQMKREGREDAASDIRRRLREVQRRKALREQGQDPDKARPKSRRVRKKRRR